MRGIRDGPGKRKVAVEAAFFARKKAGMKTRRHEIESVSAKQDRLQEMRAKLWLMLMDSDAEMSQDAMIALYKQIDEILHAPMLIWKNGVLYNSWANCLSNRTNSDVSSGDTEVSPFLMEESR